MTWREVTRKVYDCDRCKDRMFTDPEFESTITFDPGVESLSDYIDREENHWREISPGRFVCRNCWHWCEGYGDDVEGPLEDCKDPECVEAR